MYLTETGDDVNIDKFSGFLTKGVTSLDSPLYTMIGCSVMKKQEK